MFLIEKCEEIAERLILNPVDLSALKNRADVFDEKYLKELILRIDKSILTDPELAIGTAKDLVEACCKSILDNAGYKDLEKLDIPKLTKKTLSYLQLVPEGVSHESKGREIIKIILRNLGAIGNGFVA